MRAYRAKTLYTGTKTLHDVYIIVEGKGIKGIVKKKPECDIIEAEVITPAFIDAHSHIGMIRAGEPASEEETNETLDQILPLNNPLDSAYFDDVSFQEAKEFGVLYSALVPGSGNLIGGKAVVIRNFAKNREQAFLREIGYKMALGFNPKSTTRWKGTRPSTRMGLYALLEKKFSELKRKLRKHEIEEERKKRELNRLLKRKKLSGKEVKRELELFEEKLALELNEEELCLKELLEGKKLAKVHVHKEDDILYLISLLKKFEIKATIEHASDVHTREIFDKLRKENIGICYGPIDAFAYKVELKHESWKNVKHLIASQARFCVISDHPVTLARNLFLQARFLLYYGMSKEQVIEKFTLEPARLLRIDDILGSLEQNKLASFLLWQKDPFEFGAKPFAALMEGRYEEFRL